MVSYSVGYGLYLTPSFHFLLLPAFNAVLRRKIMCRLNIVLAIRNKRSPDGLCSNCRGKAEVPFRYLTIFSNNLQNWNHSLPAVTQEFYRLLCWNGRTGGWMIFNLSIFMISSNYTYTKIFVTLGVRRNSWGRICTSYHEVSLSLPSRLFARSGGPCDVFCG